MKDGIKEKFFGSFITGLAFASFMVYGYLYIGIDVRIVDVFCFFLLGLGGYVYLRLSQYKFFYYFSLSVLALTIMGVWMLLRWDFYRVIIFVLNCGIIGMYHSVFRRRVLLKPLVIAVSWILWLLFFTMHPDVVFYFQQFVWIALLTIPFDIKSKNTDKISTIPNRWGVECAVNLTRFLSLVYLMTSFFVDGWFRLNGVIMFCLVNIFLSIKSSFYPFRVYYYYDGIIVLQTLSYYFMKTLF
ncbi:MAG: hypothetical protein D6799_06370 [Bacteroidetes bacterium]|nr:MAG: hypothetical protein D6799_06370 [Bacteroidota bacterium]